MSLNVFQKIIMGGVSNIRVSTIRFSRVHAHVMETCMRRFPGQTVGIESLLLNPRTNTLVAVYWTHMMESYPEVHELHAILDDSANLNEYCPLHTTNWNQYTLRLLPSGDVKYL
jgi:hypothetical protein